MVLPARVVRDDKLQTELTVVLAKSDVGSLPTHQFHCNIDKMQESYSIKRRLVF
jgi:hypothetical protein